uniref:2-oxoglutarate and iron dependent oxygenase domain containing 3 n=1 Tax=Oryctolagus cuniculus TaxID=9986 RepID=G1TKY7_RABIT
QQLFPVLSTKKDRALREVPGACLRTAGLGAGLALAALLLWSSLGTDDGVTEVLARRGELVAGRFVEVPCSEDYDGHRRFEGCTPRKCGRGVSDVVITREEAQRIRSIAEKGLSLGGSHGGASILDLHSGALSVGKHFVNLYRYFGDKIQNIFSDEDFQLYRAVRQKVQLAIAEAFGISASSLYLTKPTFFSRINSTEAQTAHDEYWHTHVDKVTYGSFDYTSLLYLSDYLEDFGGGRFVFVEEGANKTWRKGPTRRAHAVGRGGGDPLCARGVETHCVPDLVETHCVPDLVEAHCVPDLVEARCVPDLVETHCVPDLVEAHCVPDLVETHCVPDLVEAHCVPDLVETCVRPRPSVCLGPLLAAVSRSAELLTGGG